MDVLSERFDWRAVMNLKSAFLSVFDSESIGANSIFPTHLNLSIGCC